MKTQLVNRLIPLRKTVFSCRADQTKFLAKPVAM